MGRIVTMPNGQKMEWVEVKPGEFKLKSPGTKPMLEIDPLELAVRRDHPVYQNPSEKLPESFGEEFVAPIIEATPEPALELTQESVAAVEEVSTPEIEIIEMKEPVRIPEKKKRGRKKKVA